MDAEAASLLAVEVAAREIQRLADKAKLDGFDGMDLERYAKICLAHDHHRLSWLAKLEPEKLSDELLQRVINSQKGTSDGSPKSRRDRRPDG